MENNLYGTKNRPRNNWPEEIKAILSKITPEDCAKIVDFINLSWQAGFFDGEGTFHLKTPTPQIGSQNIECLQLYLNRHGGNIGPQVEAGTLVYAIIDGRRIPVSKYNRDCYVWTMTGRIHGPKSRSYVDKTKFLLSILPLQHNQTKIKQVIRALLALGWSSKDRWKHLIPENIENSDDILSTKEINIRKMLESGMEDVREWFE